MNGISEDLASFLQVVDKVAGAAADDGVVEARAALDGAGLLELARDTAEEDDSLQWLAHTVRIAAYTSPSLGFVLASRYAADRALGERASADGAAFSLTAFGSDPVIASASPVGTVVTADLDAMRLRAASWDDVAAAPHREVRSGLRDADLTAMSLPTAAAALDADVGAALTVWDQLTGAALAGVARRAVDHSVAYVLERRQFGAAIGSFAGLRALVADMALKADAVEALLEASILHGRTSESLSAAAGRSAVEICTDAIQAHGGYGYIDEYPVARLLRDSLSLQARAGGRRLHVARIAERELGRRNGVRA